MVKVILEMVAAVPHELGHAGHSESQTKEFHDTYLKKLSELAVNASALQFIDASLARTASDSLDAMQERMIIYCTQGPGAGSTDQLQSRERFQTEIKDSLIKLLASIKSYQERLR